MNILPISLVIFVVIFLIVLLIYSIYVKLPLEFRYEDRPSLLFLYLRALRITWARRRIKCTPELAYSQGRIDVMTKDIRLDPNNMKLYKEICGYPEGDFVPACYILMYSGPLILMLFTSDEYKLNILGIIHTGQTITQHTSLEHLHKEPFDMEVALTQSKPTEKGIQLQLSYKAYDRREMCIWEAVSTLLYRNGNARRSGSQEPAGDLQTDLIRKNEVLEETLKANMGRRYSRVSGDFNLQHLYAWTAKLVGFKQPIMQGTWTMARCLAHMQSSGIFPVKPPFHVNVEFKKPIYLPSTSMFTFIAQANKDIYRFKVEDKKTSVPHLVGYIQRS